MLRHGILGLIRYGEKTGYEIMTVFRDSLNHFWTAQTSQIYRELQTMEKAGWISQRHVSQSGRPDKNVFSITPAGQEELLRWLRGEEVPMSVRSPLLMKVFFMGELPAEENLAFFRALRDLPLLPDEGKKLADNVDFYQRAIDDPDKALYWKLTVAYGLMAGEMHRAWCDYCIRELEELQRTKKGRDRERPDAAADKEA